MRIQIRRRVNWNHVGLLLAAVVMGAPQKASADVVHNDDVIITGSLAVGFDANNGESFGFDTLRLKENNLRMHFDDTSTSASFPRNDWRIVINDTSNGGSSYFGVEDATAGRIPFRVEAGAPNHSLYVEDSGEIGVGTQNPVVEVHIVDGDTPTVRLEQDGSSGFTPQTWDLAGNETNFFIRDVSNGSKLPFRIQPNAPTSSLYLFSSVAVINDGSADYDTRIESDDNANMFFVDGGNDRVGIGTDAPQETLHVAGKIRIDDGTGAGILQIRRGDLNFHQIRGGPSNNLEVVAVGGTADISFITSGSSTRMTIDGPTGFVGILNPSPIRPLEVGTNNTNGNSAHVTAGGVWTNGSSREFKENIKEVATFEAREAVMNLKPVTYNYKVEPGEQYAGFIAEDVPELVATNSRKHLSPMDIVSVVTKVVQDQQQTIERQQATISALSERLGRVEVQSSAQE